MLAARTALVSLALPAKNSPKMPSVHLAPAEVSSADAEAPGSERWGALGGAGVPLDPARHAPLHRAGA